MANEKSVLLLNPPGTQNYLRDYYCSKTSKADYTYTPVDFLYISAYLQEHCHLTFLDCVKEGIDADELLTRLREERPDAIVTLTGYVSWREDFALFGRLKERFPEVRLIGSGDILLGSNVDLLLKDSNLDAVIYDFSSNEIVDFILNEDKEFYDITYVNSNGDIKERKNKKESKVEEIKIGIPPHDIFVSKNYEYPFVLKKPFATVLTDYSCPYRCSFCIMSVLRFKYRSVDDVINELQYLYDKNIKEIYFADQTFGANKRIFRELLSEMIRRDFGFGWVCFTRVDVVNEESIRMMKEAGCHTIIFGVEFGNDTNLEASQKDLVSSEIDTAIALCQEHGVRTVGTFLLGEPSQTVDDLKDLIDYSISLDLDFASFNVYVPRTEDYLKSVNTLDGVPCFDQSGGYVKSFSPHISDEELAEYMSLARRRFYLRPKYLLKRFFGIKTITEGKILAREGYHLASGLVK